MFAELVATVQEKWLVLATALTLLYAATKVRAYLRLRHIPGPPWSGFSDIAHIRACLGEHAYQWYTSVSDTYGKLISRAEGRITTRARKKSPGTHMTQTGPFARIGPNIVLTSSAEFWEAANAKPGYKRSEWFYKAARFDWPHDNVFTSRDVDKHDAKRKMMAPGVSFIILETFFPVFFSFVRSRYLATGLMST